MYAFIFASFVHLCLQTMLPLSWQRTIPKNVSPLSSTCSLAVRHFHNGFWAIMTSKASFENFYGKAFGILIWDIAMRNGKSTFLKNTIRNVIILIIKTLKFHFVDYVWDNVDKVIIVFTIYFLIVKNFSHSLNSKMCIRFSSLLLWLMFLGIFWYHVFILSFSAHIAKAVRFRT